jgi:hypothetical protein
MKYFQLEKFLKDILGKNIYNLKINIHKNLNDYLIEKIQNILKRNFFKEYMEFLTELMQIASQNAEKEIDKKLYPYLHSFFKKLITEHLEKIKVLNKQMYKKLKEINSVLETQYNDNIIFYINQNYKYNEKINSRKNTYILAERLLQK